MIIESRTEKLLMISAYALAPIAEDDLVQLIIDTTNLRNKKHVRWHVQRLIDNGYLSRSSGSITLLKEGAKCI